MSKEKKANLKTQPEVTVKPLGATLTNCGCEAKASLSDKKKATTTGTPTGIDVDNDL
jgi:hypothetical protein